MADKETRPEDEEFPQQAEPCRYRFWDESEPALAPFMMANRPFPYF
jgi:hypothetical protein